MYKTILKRNTNMEKHIVDQFINWTVEDEKFPIFEELINDTKNHEFELFVDLDWQCISSMKGLTIDFIRMNFDHLDVNILLTHQQQSLTEDFFIEMIETLLPTSGKNYDIFQILKMIFSVYSDNLSIQFTNKYYPTKNFQKQKKVKKEKKNYIVNTSFENIINYIEENYYDDYNKLDMKAISSYKVLSHEFIIRHAKKLDYKVIFTHQKVDHELIKKMSGIKEIPLAPLMTANNDLNFDFFLELDTDLFINPKLNKQIGDKVMKGSLKLCYPERYNHTYWYRLTKKIYDDGVLNHPAYKLYSFDTYKTTMFMDIHPYITKE